MFLKVILVTRRYKKIRNNFDALFTSEAIAFLKDNI